MGGLEDDPGVRVVADDLQRRVHAIGVSSAEVQIEDRDIMRFDAVHQRRAVGGLGGADPIASAFEDGDDLKLKKSLIFEDKNTHLLSLNNAPYGMAR